MPLFFEAEFTRFADLDLRACRLCRAAEPRRRASLKSISPPSSPTGASLRARHPSGPVAGVVKADGYGLGARPVAAALYAAGCRHFFVALLDEALAVRDVRARRDARGAERPAFPAPRRPMSRTI